MWKSLPVALVPTEPTDAGGGPFYWLGSAMSKLIVEELGADALANTLKHDELEFLRTFLRARRKAPKAPQYFTSEFVAAVSRLKA